MGHHIAWAPFTGHTCASRHAECPRYFRIALSIHRSHRNVSDHGEGLSDYDSARRQTLRRLRRTVVLPR